MSRGSRAVFLDRDGTLNREQGFVQAAHELVVLPGVPAALRRLAGAGFELVVVTSQSGIARGLYSERDLAAIHARLHEQLGGLPRAYFHCPHHPEATGAYGGACDCRKPAPGMLHQAAEVLDLRFDESYLIGDSARDILMARHLPLGTVLVESGAPWQEQWQLLEAAQFLPDHRAADLAAAVDWILAHH